MLGFSNYSPFHAQPVCSCRDAQHVLLEPFASHPDAHRALWHQAKDLIDDSAQGTVESKKEERVE